MSAGRSQEHLLKTQDGRRIMVDLSGAVGGWPVFLLHGTPGSRSGPKPRSSVLYRLGVQLISYDRPGYGGSTRLEGRRVADAAADVLAIAEDLGLNKFSVVGRSGGGPHALACAALLGSRVTRTAVLVGLAPSDAPGLDWYSGMTQDNVREYSSVTNQSAVLAERLRQRAERTASDPETLLSILHDEMTPLDRKVVDAKEIRRLLHLTYAEGLRDGPFGWLDDVLALREPWGFDLEKISCPVRLWHGADDNFTPVSHSRWLARKIPGAELKVQTDTAHFGAIGVLPEILAWACSPPTHA